MKSKEKEGTRIESIDREFMEDKGRRKREQEEAEVLRYSMEGKYTVGRGSRKIQRFYSMGDRGSKKRHLSLYEE